MLERQYIPADASEGCCLPRGVPIAFTRCLADNDYQRGHSYCIPLLLRNGKRLSEPDQATLFDLLGDHPSERKQTANLSRPVRAYLAKLGIPDPDDAKTAGLIWMHALAIGCSPAYLGKTSTASAAIGQRIPLLDSLKELEASATLGERVAVLLDTEAELPDVTFGKFCAPAQENSNAVQDGRRRSGGR